MKHLRLLICALCATLLGTTAVYAQNVAEIKAMLAEQMVLVEGDTFMMGQLAFELNEDGEQASNPLMAPRPDEFPSHPVTLSTFFIGKYEVTQKLYTAVMGEAANPSSVKGENLPVDNLTWEQAQAFIARLNAITGESYRLPTEAEWEYAARGGRESSGALFSGGENVDKFAWHAGNAKGTIQPVGTKRANDLDLYDMSGNVAEWVFDWYGSYPNVAQANPKGPSKGTHHALRGGSCADGAVACRVSFRSHLPAESVQRCGLRLAKGISLDNLPWGDEAPAN